MSLHRDRPGQPALRVAQVAPLWTTVPPVEYGGTERAVAHLTDGLVARGHDVTLFAAPGSRTSGKLMSITPMPLYEAMGKGQADEYECYANELLMEALTTRPAFDVVHSHLGYAQIPLGRAATSSVVIHTLHTAVTVDLEWVARRYPRVPMIGISRSEIARLRGRPRTWVVPHGLDPEAYRYSGSSGGPLAFLGRMSPRKNPVGAVTVALEARHPIILAGGPQGGEDYRYHVGSVLPLVDGKQVQYIGPVDQQGKNDLLGQAGALVFPVLWEEPFGLVMIEAMMCGTPVLALRSGSTAEVVEEGVTGFVGDSLSELVARLPDALRLDRSTGRRRAVERFSVSAVLDAHESIYLQALNEGKALR